MFVGGIIFKFVGRIVYWIFTGFKVPFKEVGKLPESGELIENASLETSLKVIGAFTILMLVILLGEIKCK